MKNSKILVLSILGLLVFSSCAPIYIPSAHNIPQVDEKGEAQVGAVLGTNGIDFLGSYAVKDNQAVMASISGPLTSEGNQNQHLYVEGGYGIFNRNPDWLRMSAFGGFGWGTARGESTWIINNKAYKNTASGTYIKPFVQGNIGVHSKVADVGLSSRFAYLNFLYSESDGQTPDEAVSAIMIEPVAYLSIGWDIIKIHGYGGLSIAEDSEDLNFSYNPFMLGVGIQFMFNSGETAK